VFYTAKTFDLRPLAVAFKEDALKRVVKGELLSATARKAVRTANALLEKPMTYWSEEYITTHGQKHGQARISEYRTVGKLLAKKTLMDFDGKSGAQLIERLARDWRHERITQRARWRVTPHSENALCSSRVGEKGAIRRLSCFSSPGLVSVLLAPAGCCRSQRICFRQALSNSVRRK
jgi:hypothetical protein